MYKYANDRDRYRIKVVGRRHAWEEKILSVKRGRPSLTGFIYTSDLAQTFASRVVRSAGPVNLRGDRHGLAAASAGNNSFQEESLRMRRFIISAIDYV